MKELKRMIKYLVSGIILIVVFSCGGKSRICDQISANWNRPDKSIENLDYVYQLLQSNRECLDSLINPKDILSNGHIDKEKLSRLYFDETIDTSELDIHVNLFLENSQSMWGYFKGQTDCEIAMSKILVHSGYFFGRDDMTFSFITDEIRPQNVEGEVTNFMSRLEPQSMRVGSYNKTKIADIVKTVLNNTDKNDLSILISDCIYSLEKGQSKIESVNFEWALIEEAFLNLLSETDYSVQINKYISNFQGDYFSLNPSTGGEIKNKVGFDERFERPYYVIVIGETNLLKNALNAINFKEYQGYQNSYFITQPRPAERINYRIINSMKKGSFRPDKNDPKHSIVDARIGKRGPDEGLFQFTIAANLNGIGVEDDYFLDVSKYQVSGEYAVKVQLITEALVHRDPSLLDFTHLLSLQAESNIREEEILVSLKRQTPGWIQSTHTDDDRNLDKESQKQTRGFKNLVEGIESAFDKAQRTSSSNNKNKKFYFTLRTKIQL